MRAIIGALVPAGKDGLAYPSGPNIDRVSDRTDDITQE